MKKRILKLLLMGISYSAIGLFAQAILVGILYATGLEAQQIRSIKDVTLEIELNNERIVDVFHILENSTDYRFVFDTEDPFLDQRMNFARQETTVEKILLEISKQTRLGFKQINNSISVKKANRKVRSIDVFIQERTISGNVKSDEDDQGLPGVNVFLKGTTLGTVTDVEGNYKLDIPDEDAILVFSSVGFVSEEVTVGNRSIINLTLAPDITALEEIVVIGYGTQKRSNLTGAISSISQQDVGDRAITSVEQMIQGAAPGVEVINNSGLPGTTASIKIRGVGTFRNSDPLYVVDGVVFYNEGGSTSENPLSLLNPNNIESIEILKDAASSAIYGARGANGVILITTKKGKEGAPTVSFNMYTGTARPWKKLDVLNAEQYVDLARDIHGEDNLSDKLKSEYARTTRTDWQEEIFQTGIWQDYNLSVNGGTKSMNYFVGGGYTDQDATMIGHNYKRYSANINTEVKLGKRIRLGENLSVSFTNTNLTSSPEFGGQENLLVAAVRMPPYATVEDPDAIGGFYNLNKTEDMTDAFNPVTTVRKYDRRNRHLRMLGSVYASVDLLRDLNFKSTLGLDLNNKTTYVFGQENENGDRFNPTLLDETYSYSNTIIWDNILTYSRTINGHSFSIMAGSSVTDIKGRGVSVSAADFPNEELQSLSVAGTASVNQGSMGPVQDAMLSYFGRVTYAFNDKYLFTANFRRDGSSRFDKDYRWGNFPSFSVGWNMHEENFMGSLGWLSQMKLRGGWGKNGNDRIQPYQYQALTYSTNLFYIFGTDQERQAGATIRDIPSPEIRWEESSSTGIGLDAGFLNDKIRFTFDWFSRETTGILVETPIPASSGMGGNKNDFGSPITNAADLKNSGIELSLTFENREREFQYSLSGNMSFIENEVLTLADGVDYIQSSRTRTVVGESIANYYGYVMDKVYSTQAEVDADNAAAQENGHPHYDIVSKGNTQAGDIRFKDIDGDGAVTTEDRTFIGSGIPKVNFGGNFNFWYKNFDLNISLFGVSGNKLYNDIRAERLENTERLFNGLTTLENRWREEGDVTDIPRAVESDPAKNQRISTRYVEDGSYLRIKNLSFGYSIPQSALEWAKGTISNFRIYFTAQNILTFTNYSGWDPEIGSSSRANSYSYNLNRGIDNGQYPQPRVYLGGLQITF